MCRMPGKQVWWQQILILDRNFTQILDTTAVDIQMASFVAIGVPFLEMAVLRAVVLSAAGLRKDQLL